MKERADLQNKVELQIKEIIGDYIKQSSDNNENNIPTIEDFQEKGFLQIQAPLEEPPMMQFLTLDSLKNYNTGSSIKPGNIKLNIKNLIDNIPSIGEIIISIWAESIELKICAALNLWKALKDISTISITKDQAFVIVALWKNCNSYHKINLNTGYNVTKDLFQKFQEPIPSYEKYNQIIDALIKLECIELTDEEIWLREWISKNYIESI